MIVDDSNIIPMMVDNTRIIPLASGDLLTIQYNEKFYEKVRQFFGLPAETIPDDEQIKEFFVCFMQAAK